MDLENFENDIFLEYFNTNLNQIVNNSKNIYFFKFEDLFPRIF
jgi:hypothetical protein